MNASIYKIETLGLADGPGIRTVIFFQECKLRCKFCHNPESWTKKENNYSIEEIEKKILRSKPYFQNNGGVTFSGGEPLLHKTFLIELCKRLKEEKIHIALDTAGIGDGNYKELLNLVDLVLLDIKSINKDGFVDITQVDKYNEFLNFINQLNESGKDVWIRQVIIPNINDNTKYIDNLIEFINNNINNVKKIELLPFHTMAFSKYKDLKIINPYEKVEAMDKEKCKELEDYLNNKIKKN
jgi:pyruvate formate lyase activating enzyme